MFNKIMKELEELKGQWGRVKAKGQKKSLHAGYRKAGVAAEPGAEFIANPHADIMGTSREAEIKTSFSVLKRKLGTPINFDDDKISNMWVLEDPRTGDVVTVYDYKLTNLYDEGLPSPQALRKKKIVEWSVGAKDKAVARRFLTWLRKQR